MLTIVLLLKRQTSLNWVQEFKKKMKNGDVF